MYINKIYKIMKNVFGGGLSFRLYGYDFPDVCSPGRLARAVDWTADLYARGLKELNKRAAAVEGINFDFISLPQYEYICSSKSTTIFASWRFIKNNWSYVVPQSIPVTSALEAWLLIVYTMLSNMEVSCHNGGSNFYTRVDKQYTTKHHVKELRDLITQKYDGFHGFMKAYECGSSNR